jgi:hypothetical protein
MQRSAFRFRAAILATVVLTLLAAGVIGGTMATAQGDIHVVVLFGSGGGDRFIDLDDDGVLELGDRVEFRAKLFDATATDEQVGWAFGTCLVERRITPGVSGLWRCNYLLKLAEGTITLDGLDPAGPGVYELGVTGGTGAYSAANGEGTFTDTNAGTDMQITFGP